MNLTELRTRTRRYVRDISEKRFSNAEIDLYIDECVDRMRSYPYFYNMPDINETDDVQYLPSHYHYIIALFAASRCFGVDNDFYQEQDKRNEFETAFSELIFKIENGEIAIYDSDDTEVTVEHPIDYVNDTYFEGSTTDEEEDIFE